MDFDSLDGYLLNGIPSKPQLVERLLRGRAGMPAAAAFYTGIEMLGPKTPDLTFVALRLVLAGKTADDERVKRLRDLAQDARSGRNRQAAVDGYFKELE